jgi:putative oxidoreductase
MIFGKYSDHVQLIARIALASLFIVSSLGTILGGTAAFEGFQGMVAQTGVPMVGLVTVCVLALKLFGGLALAAGFKARYAALALATFTLLTVLLVHSPSTWSNPQFGMINFLMAMKNISIIGGLLLVANNGSGAMSCRCSPHCKSCK